MRIMLTSFVGPASYSAQSAPRLFVIDTIDPIIARRNAPSMTKQEGQYHASLQLGGLTRGHRVWRSPCGVAAIRQTSRWILALAESMPVTDSAQVLEAIQQEGYGAELSGTSVAPGHGNTKQVQVRIETGGSRNQSLWNRPIDHAQGAQRISAQVQTQPYHWHPGEQLLAQSSGCTICGRSAYCCVPA